MTGKRIINLVLTVPCLYIGLLFYFFYLFKNHFFIDSDLLIRVMLQYNTWYTISKWDTFTN